MSHAKMKIALAALLACSAISVSAANPFSDVDKDHWSYKAISELSAQGIVEGYPDGSFKGDRHISRFETAQIIGRLLAKQDTLSDQQKATVNKLASAYSDDLKQLGVRLDNVEKKLGKTDLITEIRVSGMNRYDNVFKDTKKSHYELGARINFNTISKVTPRTTVYGQLQTFISLNGKPMYDVNADQHEDSKLHLGRLFVTHQFGKAKSDPRSITGPTSNIVGIGQFPVSMGVTGYTYEGNFKGAFIQFGDANKGGHLRLAYGRATDINYDYTAPMMRGIPNFGKTLEEIQRNPQSRKGIKGFAATNAKAKAKEKLENAVRFGKGTLYPLAPKVMMKQGEDADVPAAYASYIYKNPGKYEFHAYVLKAIGPVSHIAEAYGTALSYNVNDKVRIHGEYVKNAVKLPLNNERPQSYNFGIKYGNASVLKAKSFSVSLDYMYSQAGSYFGGSSSDIADQYMAHIYKDWTPTYAKTSLGKMPAYFADKFDNQIKAKTIDEIQKAATTPVGGAKFYLAKAQYVPMKGLILEASYGFNASDMGGKPMDNIFRIQATAFLK